jgi:hypothetical protein
MSVVRLGSTQKFSENWDKAFGGKKAKSATKASTKRKAGKKRSATKRGKK